MNKSMKYTLLQKFFTFIKSRKEIISIFAFYVVFSSFIFRHLLLDIGIWNYGDMLFPFNEQSLDNWVSTVSHTWWDHEFLGYDVSVDQGIPRMSYIFILKTLHFFIKDFSVVQFAWWVLIFAIAGTSMYGLTHQLFKKRSVAFVASLFYALNPWVIDRSSHVLIVQAYAFTPMLFLFYISLLNEKKFKYAFFFGCTSFFVLPSIHITFVDTLLLLLYLTYHLLASRKRSEWKICLQKNLMLTGVTFALLSFYTFPLLFALIQGGVTALTAHQRFIGTEAGFFYGGDCTVLNVIRLLGFHDSRFKGSILGSTLSAEPPKGWVYLSFIIPILWGVSLLRKEKHERFKNKRFFSVLIVLGIFLSTPTTLLNGKLFSYVRFFLLMNDPNYYVFILAFAGAPLAGVGAFLIMEEVGNALHRRSPFIRETAKLGFLMVPIMVVGLVAYPVILWNDFRYEQIHYPSEYNEMARFLNQQDMDFRILLLPPEVSVKHDWSPYPFYLSSDTYLLRKPIFGRWIAEATPQASIDFSILTKQLLEKNPSSHLARIFRFANVKYIVLMNDTETEPPYVHVDPNQMDRYFHTVTSQRNIHLERQFGDIFIYEIGQEDFLPRVYPTRTVIYSNFTLENVIKIAEITQDVMDPIAIMSEKGEFNLDEYHLFAGVSFEYSLRDLSNWVGEDGKHPAITYQKFNPAEYRVNVSTSVPFLLVFSESYSPQWKAYISDVDFKGSSIGLGSLSRLFDQPVPEKYHVLVNGYANAWYITAVGNFSITLYHLPQNTFHIGIVFSVLTLSICIIYITWTNFRASRIVPSAKRERVKQRK